MSEFETELKILNVIAHMSCHGVECNHCAMNTPYYCIRDELNKLLGDYHADDTNSDTATD